MVLFNFSGSKLKTGDKLPEMILYDQDNNTVNTKSFRNKWYVLYFYPKDHTRGCTRQSKDYSKLSKVFKDHDIVVYGINTQKPQKHCGFKEKHSLNINLLSDKDGRLAKLLGVKILFGLCMRDTIVIDPDGKINKIFRNVNPSSDAEKIFEYINNSKKNQ